MNGCWDTTQKWLVVKRESRSMRGGHWGIIYACRSVATRDVDKEPHLTASGDISEEI